MIAHSEPKSTITMQFDYLKDRLTQYARLVRADKPIGALLLMWPMLWTLWIVSAGQPDLLVLVVFVTGTFMMRSAGCAINDYADRHIDGAVDRSKDRPIVSGRVTPKEALMVAAILAFMSFLLVLTMNRLTIAMSFIGVVLAAVYPFSKRITYWPQLVLGLAFGWAVPMVNAAQTGTVSGIGWMVFLAAILWALAYDTIYAMVDRDDDLKLGVKSTAIRFGRFDVIAVAITLLSVLMLLVFIGLHLSFGAIYFCGVGVGALVVVRQLWLIKNRDRNLCFQAFMLSNFMGLFVFIGLVLHFLQN